MASAENSNNETTEPPGSISNVSALLSSFKHANVTDGSSSDESRCLLANFEKLKEKTLERKPILAEIISERGDKTLYEYAKGYSDVNLNPAILQRQKEFIGTVQSETALHFGNEAAQDIANQLRHVYFIFTNAHHGPPNPRDVINGYLLLAVLNAHEEAYHLDNIIVLSCGQVSLNNVEFPRGLLFHSLTRGGIQRQRLPLLPSTHNMSTVYNSRPYTEEDLKRMEKMLLEKTRSGEIDKLLSDRIVHTVNDIYHTPELLSCHDFPTQITRTNNSLWQRLSPHYPVRLPRLIYLEQEWIVARLLIEHHLHTDTTITHMLFDPEYEKLIERHFDNIYGAFSLKERTGTYFFWAVPKGSRYRVQLWKEGNFLISSDGSYRIALEPDEIKQALEARELIPNLHLTSILLSFYYGVKCLGGYSQVNYLTFMKNAYLKLQADRGNYKSIEVCARVQTKEWAGYTLAFLGTKNGMITPATGLDLILYGDEEMWQRLTTASRSLELRSALDPVLPEIYRYSYPDSERDPELAKITETQISEVTRLYEKIFPCAKIL